MLDTLRRIVQEVNAAQDLEQALRLIVQRVKQAMGVDVCSIYLTDPTQGQHVLMATDGLNPTAVGTVRLAARQGLIGQVADREETINLADAPNHPQYQYFPETGEEHYLSFLGVPIVHHRKVLGVLVVQRRASERFDENKVTFLITIAAQLAGAIAHAEASGGVNGLRETAAYRTPFVEGQPGSPGVGEGIAVVCYPLADLEAVPDRKVTDPAAEEASFQNALAAVRADIQGMLNRMQATLPAEDRALFDAYLLMLESDTLVGGTQQRIQAGNWAPGALRDTIREHVRIFDTMEDSYLRERAEDVRDLGRRILVRLQGNGARVARRYPPDTVLVGEEITASMLAEVPLDQLRGVVSLHGSRTSHVAILARAMGIPAAMGVSDLPVGRVDGHPLIVDGYLGRVYVDPTPAVAVEYRRLAREDQALSDDLQAMLPLPSETQDGVRMPLYVNSGLLADITSSRNSGADGVGLYRTEFPFMVRDRFPGEDEQTAIYRQVLETFAPRPVVLRTLDVGGDKALPYFPIVEDNPFLGWRGIRITLDHPEIFLVQLRAMLRASAGFGNMQILLPMISSVTELEDTLRLLRRAHHELLDAPVGINMPKIGVMIEVPSAVYQVEALAQRVDFLSIGSNDLTQYLLAVDRNNARVAELYDSLHPAVLRAMHYVVEGAHRVGKPVSVCGEMAGDPATAILLLGMGVDSLSMSSANLPRVKWVIRSFTQAHARNVLQHALTLDYTSAVHALLKTELEQAGLGSLIRGART